MSANKLSPHVCVLSYAWLFVTPWTVAHQAPLSMGFSRPEYWSGLPYPPLEDLPDSGIKPACPALASGFFTTALVDRFFISPHQFTILTKYQSAERQEFERAESQTMEVERSRFNLNLLFPFSYCVTWDRLAWYIATEKLVSGLFNLSSLFHPKERCYL